MKEAVETAAQGVIDGVAADAAAFPWVAAIICVLVVGPVIWGIVEAVKATGVSKLKRKPPKDAGEQTVVGKITKVWPWYPVLIWAISVIGGAALGFGVGAIDGFGDGDLGLWGIAFGASAGVTNSIAMKLLRSLGDKASDLLLGWAKRRLNGGKEEEG